MVKPYANLVELFEDACRRFGDRPLYGTKAGGDWKWTSYREFRDLVDALRGGLAGLGVKPGDRVAIVSNNRIEWAVVAYATFGLGATLVPMYEAQRPDEWKFILADSGTTVVIGSTAPIVDRLDAIRREIPSLRHVVALERTNGAPGYAALLAEGRRRPVPPHRPAPDAVACIIYTSGTTGRPKGVVLTHGNITSNIAAAASVFPLDPEDRTLSFLPWAHAYGQVVEVHYIMSRGASSALNTAIPKLIDELAEVRPTMLVAVPRIFNRLYISVMQQMEKKPHFVRSLFESAIAIANRKRRGEKIRLVDRVRLRVADRLVFSRIRAKLGGRLKYAITASAAIEPHVAELIDALGIPVYEGYGLTETSPIVAGNYPGTRKLGTVGKPMPGVRVVIDTSVSSVPGEGELVVYGPNVMREYWNRPDENAKVFLPDRGFRTGDLGTFDEDGFLRITGRIKEQYKLTNGKYVMPTPLEEQLKLSPYVANVMIYGDNRPYNVALVVPNVDAVREWAKQSNIELGPDLTKDPAVRKLIEGEIERCSAESKGYEKPKAFALTLEDFTCDNGMLTPTLKLKRKSVLDRYKRTFDELYAQPAPEQAAHP